MQWRGVSRVMPCAADPEKFGGLGWPRIRGQRELRTEIVACLGKNRRLRSNVEGKPWILFLFCSARAVRKFLLGGGDCAVSGPEEEREREGWQLLANVNLIRACRLAVG